jgi:hypothetical protein
MAQSLMAAVSMSAAGAAEGLQRLAANRTAAARGRAQAAGAEWPVAPLVEPHTLHRRARRAGGAVQCGP